MNKPFVITICCLLSWICAVCGFAGSVSKTVLPNGLTVLIKPEPGSGIVAVDAFVRAGQAEERPPLAGIGNLVARTLMTSTLNNSTERLANAIDEVGGNFQTVWNADFTELRVITTSANFEDATRIIGEILSNATFPERSFEEARKAVLEEIHQSGDDVFGQAYLNSVKMLYKDNAYGRPLSGESLTLRKLTREDALSFYKQYFVPNNTVIAIVGDVTEERAAEAARMAFAGARLTPLPIRRTIPDEELESIKSQVLQRDIPAAYVLVGYLAPGMTNPDYRAFTVVTALLGGGKASRLFRNIRDKHGIGYDLGVLYPLRANQSHIVLYVSVDARRFESAGASGGLGIDELRKLLIQQVDAVKEGNFTDTELQRAKNYAAGSWLLRHQRAADRAYLLGSMEAMGLGYQFDADLDAKIEAVTSEDLRKVCEKYFNNYCVEVVVPNSTEAEEKQE